jgi:recombinational DNA repair ATPase RecF
MPFSLLPSPFPLLLVLHHAFAYALQQFHYALQQQNDVLSMLRKRMCHVHDNLLAYAHAKQHVQNVRDVRLSTTLLPTCSHTFQTCASRVHTLRA